MFGQFLLVGVGGAAGAMLRFLVSVLIGSHLFPWATLIINIAGALAIGALWAACSGSDWFDSWGRLILVTGLLGGFTTYSAFSLETVNLLHEGRFSAAGVYVFGTLIGCLAACWFGYRWLN